MTAHDILQLIRRDAQDVYLSGSDALPAFTEIVAELAGRISADDLTTLIAIGTVIYRDADACHEMDGLMTRLRATGGSGSAIGGNARNDLADMRRSKLQRRRAQ